MVKIKKIGFASLLLIGLTLTTTCLASEAQERVYLIQMLNQLNAIQPLMIAAEKEQPKNQRIQFHYTQFRDSQGQLHNGLLEDIQAIKAGIEEKLNQVSIEPRTTAPIEGDYMPVNGGQRS